MRPVFTGEDRLDGQPDAVGDGAFAEFERAPIRASEQSGTSLRPLSAARTAARKPCPTAAVTLRQRATAGYLLGAASLSSTSAGKPSTSTSARTTDTCRVADPFRPRSGTPLCRRKSRHPDPATPSTTRPVADPPATATPTARLAVQRLPRRATPVTRAL